MILSFDFISSDFTSSGDCISVRAFLLRQIHYGHFVHAAAGQIEMMIRRSDHVADYPAADRNADCAWQSRAKARNL
jgi:hypothetical protein